MPSSVPSSSSRRAILGSGALVLRASSRRRSGSISTRTSCIASCRHTIVHHRAALDLRGCRSSDRRQTACGTSTSFDARPSCSGATGCWWSWISSPGASLDSACTAMRSTAPTSVACSMPPFVVGAHLGISVPIMTRCSRLIVGRRIFGFSRAMKSKQWPMCHFHTICGTTDRYNTARISRPCIVLEQTRPRTKARRLPGLLQCDTHPRVVGRQHAVGRRRRKHCRPCRPQRCALGLSLPGSGPAPSGGLTTNSRRTRVSVDGGRRRLVRSARGNGRSGLAARASFGRQQTVIHEGVDRRVNAPLASQVDDGPGLGVELGRPAVHDVPLHRCGAAGR